MKNSKYDISRVPRELLERFIDCHSILDPHFVATSLVAKDIQEAARVPLRTRSEVDADIVDLVRTYHKWINSSGPGYFAPYYNSSFRYKDKNVKVNELLAELNEEDTSD